MKLVIKFARPLALGVLGPSCFLFPFPLFLFSCFSFLLFLFLNTSIRARGAAQGPQARKSSEPLRQNRLQASFGTDFSDFWIH